MVKKKSSGLVYVCLKCKLDFKFVPSINSVPCPVCFSSCNVVRGDNFLVKGLVLKHHKIRNRVGFWSSEQYVEFLAKKKEGVLPRVILLDECCDLVISDEKKKMEESKRKAIVCKGSLPKDFWNKIGRR